MLYYETTVVYAVRRWPKRRYAPYTCTFHHRIILRKCHHLTLFSDSLLLHAVFLWNVIFLNV